MKHLSILLLLLLCASDIAAQTPDKGIVWTPVRQKQHLLDREDSTKWDRELLNDDLEYLHDTTYVRSRPIKDGVWPTPRYEILGDTTYNGNGFWPQYRKFGNNNLFYTSFFTGTTRLTAQYFPKDQSDEVFFLIVVLSDVKVDTVDYSHTQNAVISRNNPDYIGEGFVKTVNDEIDYLSFITADRNAYAVVNMRLFDLRYGRVVLVAPQKDGSLRSMQLDPGHILSSKDVAGYVDELLKKQSVADFFSAAGNI